MRLLCEYFGLLKDFEKSNLIIILQECGNDMTRARVKGRARHFAFEHAKLKNCTAHHQLFLMFGTICLTEFIILKQAYLVLTIWKNPAFFHVKFNRKLHMGVSCHAMLKVNTDTFWKLVQKFVVFIFIIWLIQMNKQSDLDRSMHKKIAKIEISENIEWKVWFLFTVFTFP